MKTKIMDGIEYEVLDWVDGFMTDDDVIILRPVKAKPKTIVQMAAEAWGSSEEEFRTHKGWEVYDAIEQRLQALEKKLEGK
jgi:hypothetical protein